MKYIFLILILSTRIAFSQTYNVNGFVEDSESKEKLIGCYVYDSISKQSVLTNSFGYFSLTLKEGEQKITAHYLGYSEKTTPIHLTKDTNITISLAPSAAVKIEEVTITTSRSEEVLSRPQMSQMNLSSKEIKKLPTLLGEADVMRSIQTLPGIHAANERSTGVSIRGGSIDQNLYLLDDAPVYQISHVGGFYSVFNNDAIKDIKIFKGDIPANYGGRLSSVVDIRLKDGNMARYEVSGGLGVIASNLNIEGPIVKERISFIASGKYSYIGGVYKLLNPNMDLNFYDFNCKLNAIINNKSRVYISSYVGGDHTGNDLNTNKTLSFRWNYVYNPKLFGNISFIYSNYSFQSNNNASNTDYSYSWQSGISTVILKADYNYYLNDNITLDFGLSSSLNVFNPGELMGNQNVISNIQKKDSTSKVMGEQKVLEHAGYISAQHKLSDRISLKYGFRACFYQNIGNDNWVYRLNNYQITDSFYASKNNVYANYFNLEPRLGLNYRLTKTSALKAGYTYTSQQTQLLMKTNGGGPLDVWFPSGTNIKPQTSSQYSLGFVQYFIRNLFEMNIEGYYKHLNNIIDYKDGATFLSKNSVLSVNKTNYNFEEQLRAGKGFAYGTELTLRNNYEKVNGFISYTYARSYRQIDGINHGDTYLSPFDKPHTFDIFLNINLTKRMSFSGNFRYQNGQVTTVPVYTIEMWGKVLSGYSKRNEYRLPSYQRLDVSLVIKNKRKEGKRFQSEWNISVLNVLNHPNIVYLEFHPSSDQPGTIKANGVSVLGILPSVSYHFNF